jgi:hypothetical protein
VTDIAAKADVFLQGGGAGAIVREDPIRADIRRRLPHLRSDCYRFIHDTLTNYFRNETSSGNLVDFINACNANVELRDKIENNQITAAEYHLTSPGQLRGNAVYQLERHQIFTHIIQILTQCVGRFHLPEQERATLQRRINNMSNGFVNLAAGNAAAEEEM